MRIHPPARVFLAALALILTLAAGYGGQLPGLVDLSASPGSESTRVTRLLSANGGDNVGTSVGESLAYGDLNGDGYDDLVVGASQAAGLKGEIHVVLGHGAPASLETFNSPGLSPVPASIVGPAIGSQAGNAVACGDVNGDGFDDAIIGASFHDANGTTDTGAVYVVFGRSDLEAQTIDLSSTPTLALTRIFGDAENEFAGYSVASGDVNGDGIDDIIIGAPGARPQGRTQAGAVYVIYGSASLPGQTINLSTDGAVDIGGARIIGPEAFCGAGFSVATGDVNGDGLDDLLIGAPLTSIGPRRSGIAYMIYGDPALAGQTYDLAAGTLPVTVPYFVSDAGGDEVGFAVACGDVNADGYADMIIGAPGSRQNRLLHSGSVYLYFGSPGIPGGSHNVRMAPTSGGAIIDSRYVNGQMGASLAAGDVNGDGRADLILGAWRAPYVFGRDAAGEAYVIFGSPSLAGTTVPLIGSQPDVRVLGGAANDWLGASAAAGGDYDLDGYGDLSLTAPLGDNPLLSPGNNSGYAATIYGNGSAAAHVATGTVKHPPGNAVVRKGAGGRLSPSVRTLVQFSAGTGPSNQASTTSVTLTRDNAGISNIGYAGKTNVAGVFWHVQTDRTSFGSVALSFQYTDAEISGLSEPGLWLFQAASPSGVWSTVPTQVRIPERNQFVALVNNPAYFAIVDITAPTPTPSPTPSPTATPSISPSPTATLIPGNAAAEMSDTVPATIGPGETIYVSLTMLNAGTTTWSSAAAYKLALINDPCGTWSLGEPRVNIVDFGAVMPGHPYTFAFPITAPASPGPCSIQLQMMEELVETFGPVVTLTFDSAVPPNAALDWSLYE